MFRSYFVLTLCIYGILAALEDFDEWQYDVGSPSINNGGGDSKCRKDLLLIVDTSYSIGENDFNNNVKKFLKNLVTDSRLNVGPDGTQIGLILFSSVVKTVIKLRIGQIQDAQQLGNYMKSLQWSQVSGGHTRTDKGLDLAKGIFTQESPLNYRRNVDDVIVLLTDGEPRGRGDTLQLTKQNAQDLKNRKITLVAAAVGRKSEERQFQEILKELATSSDYFLNAKFNEMDSILGTLVAKSCIKPGSCVCGEITSQPFYVQPGNTKAMAHWPKPTFKCATGGKVALQSIVVSPSVTSPHAFAPGEHVISYTYNLRGGVKVSCPVKIIIKGLLCRGKPFHDSRQICCCGTIHDVSSGYACCGPDYYDTSTQKCCSFANLIPTNESCPY